MDSDGASRTAPPKPVKRQLFKKSAFARPPPTEEDAIGLFSRSKEIFQDVIKENQRERIAKQKAQQLERDAKRRRISDNVQDGGATVTTDDGTAGEAGALDEKSRSHSSTPTIGDQISTRSHDTAAMYTSPKSKPSRAPPRMSTRTTSGASEKHVVHVLDDSDDELINSVARGSSSRQMDVLHGSDNDNHGRRLSSPLLQGDDPTELEEIEEFPELVARARERARAQELSTNDRLAARLAQLRGEVPKGSPESGSSIKMSGTDTDDVVIRILVSARLDGTKPIVVKRKMSQRLRDVRIAWCDLQIIDGQPLSDDLKAKFFLTWRGHKLFDISCGRSLGLKPDAHGTLVGNGDGFQDGMVHLEAWTDESFTEYKKRQEEERRHAAIDHSYEDEEDIPLAPTVEIAKLKLIMIGKDRKEVKVQVSADAKIQRLINSYRQKAEIPAETKITLRFDGDVLEPQSTVEDADMDDMTKIDVHLD